MTAAISFHTRDLRIAGIVMMIGAFIVPLFTNALPEVFCPLRAATGVPCPLCGMTTSVTAVAQLDFGTALAANPAGLVAVAGAVTLLFVRRRQVRVPVAAAVVLVAGMWLFELARYGFL